MAARYYRKALLCQQEIDDRTGASWTLLHYGELCWKLADFTRAHDYANQALQAFTEHTDKAGSIAARQLIADVYYWECKFREAERAQRDLMDHVDTKSASPVPLADAIHRLSEIHRFQGRLKKSRTEYSRCRHLYTEWGASYGLGWTLAGLGDINRMQGDLASAFRLTNEALAIFGSFEFPVGIAWCSRGLAEVLRHEQKYDGASELYEYASKLFSEANDLRGHASCTASMAEIALALGKLDSATNMFVDAIDILDRQFALYACARAWRGLAATKLAGDELDQSTDALDRADDLFSYMGNKYQLGLSAYLRGRICLALGRRSAAVAHFTKALTSCRAEEDCVHEVEIQVALSEIT